MFIQWQWYGKLSIDNTEGSKVLSCKALGALAHMQICHQIQQLHNSTYHVYARSADLVYAKASRQEIEA